MSYKPHFSRFLGLDPDARAAGVDPELLSFTAHSHHPWPDVTLAAHQAAWDLAMRDKDEKWETILAEVLPACQEHVARLLGLEDPRTLAFASNTHEFLTRLVSSLEGPRPLRVLSTDGEFHSFTRQARRWVEAGQVELTQVPLEPYADFGERFCAEVARAHDVDLIYVSEVFFNSGLVFDRLEELVASVPNERTLVVIDGYHGFMARPTDLSAVQGRAFYLSGGYKYAMAGEGVCFAHCPPGHAPRPVDTGWFAGFDALESGSAGPVPYSEDGWRLWGATLDPTAFFRLRAVLELWHGLGVGPAEIHTHVRALQQRFLAQLDEQDGPLRRADLTHQLAEGANFLTFVTPRAGELRAALRARKVLTDYRGDRFRVGFGIYHDPEDVDELVRRLARL